MTQEKPSFWSSPYFVREPDNWHLKEGAPEEVKKAFEEYMQEDTEEANKQRINYLKKKLGK